MSTGRQSTKTRTITVEQLWASTQTLSALLNGARSADIGITYRLLKLHKGVEPHTKEDAPHERARRELLDRYGTKMENSKDYFFPTDKPENFAAFEAGMKEIGEDELVIPDIRFTPEELSKLELRTGLTAAELASIEWMIIDEEVDLPQQI